MATSVEERCLRQIEYYFSDNSFPFDEFMQGLSKSEGKDGFIDLSVLVGACYRAVWLGLFARAERLATSDDQHKSQSSDLARLSSGPPVRTTLFFSKLLT